MWMLDTDIASYILRDRPPQVRRRFESQETGKIAVSSIVLAELFYGAVKRGNDPSIRSQIGLLLRLVTPVAWGADAAEHFAEISVYLERRGTPLPTQDLMIAAHARSLDAILVTNNLKHFRRVPGLKTETWV